MLSHTSVVGALFENPFGTLSLSSISVSWARLVSRLNTVSHDAQCPSLLSSDTMRDDPVKCRTVKPKHKDLGVCLRPLEARYTMS